MITQTNAELTQTNALRALENSLTLDTTQTHEKHAKNARVRIERTPKYLNERGKQ